MVALQVVIVVVNILVKQLVGGIAKVVVVLHVYILVVVLVRIVAVQPVNIQISNLWEMEVTKNFCVDGSF